MGFPTCRLRASDIMEPNLTYVYPHTRIQSLVSILRTTVHHAFPVVTENRGNEKEFMKGNQLISNNIKFKVMEQPERKGQWFFSAPASCLSSPTPLSWRRHGEAAGKASPAYTPCPSECGFHSEKQLSDPNVCVHSCSKHGNRPLFHVSRFHYSSSSVCRYQGGFWNCQPERQTLTHLGKESKSAGSSGTERSHNPAGSGYVGPGSDHALAPHKEQVPAVLCPRVTPALQPV